MQVRATAYPVDEIEYGLHWNFFFTLAVVASASTMLEAPTAYADAMRAMLILTLHQAALLAFGTEYVTYAPRDTLLSATYSVHASGPSHI